MDARIEDASWITGIIDGFSLDEEPGGHGDTAAEGWLILRGGVPARWRDRAVPLHLVPLLPQETAQMLAGVSVVPPVSAEDEPLLHAVARGVKASTMARELGVGLRTVERRLARLRRRFEVPSTADLTTLLARLGFGRLPSGGP